MSKSLSDTLLGILMFGVVLALPVGGFLAGSASEKWRIDISTKLSENYRNSEISTNKLIQTLEDMQAKHCVWNKEEIDDKAL